MSTSLPATTTGTPTPPTTTTTTTTSSSNEALTADQEKLEEDFTEVRVFVCLFVG